MAKASKKKTAETRKIDPAPAGITPDLIQSRCQQLSELGLKFDPTADAYVLQDINIDNKTEICLLDSDQWNELMMKIVPIVGERLINQQPAQPDASTPDPGQGQSQQPAPDPVGTPPPPPPPPIARVEMTQEVITAQFNLELSRLQYQQALQNLENYTITVDNMAEAQLKLTKARRFVGIMESIKDRRVEPAKREWQNWNAVFNSLKKPLEELLKKKAAELKKVADDQANKAAEVKKETDRKERIKKEIDNFIIQQSVAIAAAKEPAELVVVEKLIGANKVATTKYEEFLPDFVERCKELTALIVKQKATIKGLKKVKKAKQTAIEEKDDAKVLELTQHEENLEQESEETKVGVQEVAINQALSPSVIEATPIYTTISARRTVWKAELVKKPGTEEPDPKELKNAFNAGLLKCEIDKSKTDLVLKTLEGSGALKDKKELIVNGIRYYEEKTY